MTAQTAEKVNMAQDYANDIANGLEMLEEITSKSDWADVSPESVEHANSCDWLDSDSESPREAASRFIEDALEIRKTVSLNTNEVTAFEFLLTYGGPNCWVKFDGTSYATVKVYWGSDRGERRVNAEELSLYVFNALGE